MTLKKKPFKNFVGKGENAGKQHFLLFPQCILPIPKRISVLSYIYFFSANAFNLHQSKNLSFGKGLKDKSQLDYICFLQILLSLTSLEFGCLVQKPTLYPLCQPGPYGDKGREW